MIKIAAILVLAVAFSEAGVLQEIGKGTDYLGTAINKGASKAQEGLYSLFGSRKQQQPVVPAVPAVPVVPAITALPTTTKVPLRGPAYLAPAKSAPAKQPTNPVLLAKPTSPKADLGAYVINYDDEAPEIEDKNPQQGNKDKQDQREQITGAVRCGPDEVFIASACRPKD